MNDQRDEKDIIRPYVVDGIEEYDNPMPPWWVAMFKITIVFGFMYMIWIHWFGWNHLDAELSEDRAAYSENQSKRIALDKLSDADFAKRASNPELIADGKSLFQANCAPCHGGAGEGIVGPNLTDNFWLHGSSPSEIVAVITNGVPEKGMVSWGPVLGAKKIQSLAAFVLSLRGSNPPNAKAPQGEEEKP
jgi:cytochrome c oxidase cbb3-type subunit 3